jgi:hypothetical protein
MSLKVVAQFPGSNENYIQQFMHFQISCLGVMEDFTNEVHRALDGLDPPWGSDISTSIGSGSRGMLPPGTQRCFRELGPDNFPVTGTRHVLWRHETNLGIGSWGCLWFMGPDCISFSWLFCRLQILGSCPACSGSLWCQWRRRFWSLND